MLENTGGTDLNMNNILDHRTHNSGYRPSS